MKRDTIVKNKLGNSSYTLTQFTVCIIEDNIKLTPKAAERHLDKEKVNLNYNIVLYCTYYANFTKVFSTSIVLQLAFKMGEESHINLSE